MLLLTPGPLTTHPDVRARMAVDYGSRDPAFVAMSDRVRATSAALVGDPSRWAAIPLQGSGTFAVEATLGTLVPRDGRLLVLVQGAYGHRMVDLARRAGREVVALVQPETRPTDAAALRRALADDPRVTHVAAVVCETTTGLATAVGEVAAVVREAGRSLILDAMSAFGAFHLTEDALPFDALVASSNKCLEGPPGMGLAVVRREALAGCAGRCHSVSLDLYEQHARFEQDGQWRFTPPTHVLAAFDRALALHADEGGVAGRRARYAENCRVLVDGMRALGFTTLLDDAVQAPIIVTFHQPADLDFRAFYDALVARGFAIYPGKLTEAPTFRVGCIGQVFPDDLRRFVDAVAAVR